MLTRGAFDAPLPPARHTLGVRAPGCRSRSDGEALSPVALIERLEAARARRTASAGASTSARRSSASRGGSPSRRRPRRCCITAHRELEKLTLTGRQLRVKETVAAVYGDLVHEGQHLDPVCRDIEALLLSLAGSGSRARSTCCSGPGQVFVEGVRSPYSLRRASRGVYGEAAGEWTAADARGFSRIVGPAGRCCMPRPAAIGVEREAVS